VDESEVKMTIEEISASIIKMEMAVKNLDESVYEEWQKGRLADLLFKAWCLANNMKKTI